MVNLSQLHMLCSIFFNRFTLLLPNYWLLNTRGFRFWFLFRRIFNRFTISCRRSFCWGDTLLLFITRRLLLLPLLCFLGLLLLSLLLCLFLLGFCLCSICFCFQPCSLKLCLFHLGLSD